MSTPPALGALRLARLADLPRIGVVATAGFYHSPVFHYCRPYYQTYLSDTIAAYRAGSQSAILDRETVCIVAEADYNESESDAVFPELKAVYPPIEDQLGREKSEITKVIVGIAQLSLKEDPERQGQFQPEGDHENLGNLLSFIALIFAGDNPTVPNDPENQRRDVFPEAAKHFGEVDMGARAK